MHKFYSFLILGIISFSLSLFACSDDSSSSSINQENDEELIDDTFENSNEKIDKDVKDSTDNSEVEKKDEGKKPGKDVKDSIDTLKEEEKVEGDKPSKDVKDSTDNSEVEKKDEGKKPGKDVKDSIDTLKEAEKVEGDKPGKDVKDSTNTNESNLNSTFKTAKTNKYGMAIGTCIDDALKKESLLEYPQAYIIEEKDKIQLFMPSVKDYCNIVGSVIITIKDDTLLIKYGEDAAMSKCLCLSDHWFDITEEQSKADFVLFGGITYKVNR